MVRVTVSEQQKRLARSRRPFDSNLLRAGGNLEARVHEAVPYCWFCARTSGRRGGEHLFPRWLQRHYGIEREVIEPYRVGLSGTGQMLSQRSPITLKSATVKICSSCNNEWMSQLEEQARPLLIRTHPDGPISPVEAEVLTRWFTRTSIALNVSMPYRLLYPEVERHALRHGVPPRTVVALARTSAGAGVVDWVQRGLAYGIVPPHLNAERVRSLQARVHAVNIRIADLIATVVHLPSPLQSKHLLIDEAQRIWPPAEPPPTWEGLPMVKSYLTPQVGVDLTGLWVV